MFSSKILFVFVAMFMYAEGSLEDATDVSGLLDLFSPELEGVTNLEIVKFYEDQKKKKVNNCSY